MISSANLPEVIQKAKLGDRKAFQQLVERFQGFLYRVAFRMVPSKPDAEDIVQEVFIKMWRNLHKYNPEIRLTTWLYKMVMNQSLDFLKSKGNRLRYHQVDFDGLKSLTSTHNPEKDYQQAEWVNLVYQAAEELSPHQKAVFVLRDLESLSVDEVCTVLEMSSGNLKSNLYYARQAIQRKLSKLYEYQQGIK